MEIDNNDLSEMLGIAQLCKQAGFTKVQLDTQIAIEILNRLIKAEQRKSSAPGEKELQAWLLEMREIADALCLAAENSLGQDRREFERGDVGDIDQLEDAINAYRNFHKE